MNIQRLYKLTTSVGSCMIKNYSNNNAKKLVPFSFCNTNLLKFEQNEARVGKSVSTIEVARKPDSLVKKILNKIPFIDLKKSKSQAIAYLLYETIVDKINYLEFFEKYELPDTFYSWFAITELYIWMFSARAMAEGNDGKHLRNFLLEALWADVAIRSKKLDSSNPSSTRMQVSMLSEQLQASLIAYDEGLQSDDVVLAGAVWRRFYQHEYTSPELIDSLVKLIRKQMLALDHLSKDQLFSKDITNWTPLVEKN